ncbi:unnamed protein product [Didymodactylos carnosus]|uniref:Delta(24)-sterol reductase n=1 Tax=Didymodactylos carnosus TaxID=1234261 RepID=A0A815WY47_9BILA|nr:unnamed protein product [Didymodactylos carnosus]CAF1549231.1 unnamed protein product [Didymodactylos carnosus]CAF4141930.1 unnamed protein product [Didymodactylos carnosus]CAF4410149.1 unnamed protein product [Didymodactylos carnosus]
METKVIELITYTRDNAVLGTRQYFMSTSDHEKHIIRIQEEICSRKSDERLSLHKRIYESNTIRNSPYKQNSNVYKSVDLHLLNKILSINLEKMEISVQPGLIFQDLVDVCIKYKVMPLIVVEFPGITIGGSVQGGGLESSSFKHGWVIDTVLKMDVITGDGQLYKCSPTQYNDLFYGVSASFNTLGIITQVTLQLQPAFNYVNLSYSHFENCDQALKEIENICTSDEQPNYLEGIIFKHNSIMIVKGYHTNIVQYPLLSFGKYYNEWYYKVIQKLTSKSDNISSIHHCVSYCDYVFRYNYGAFWMASTLLDHIPLGETKLFQFLFGSLLTTKNLFRTLHYDDKMFLKLSKYKVVQDIQTSFSCAKICLNYVQNDMAIYPIWLCPIKCTKTPQFLASHYSLDHDFMLNIGIYGRPLKFPYNPGELHKKLIELMIDTNSRSGFYAQCWHTKDQFQRLLGENLEKCEQIKVKYNSQNKFFNLFDKVTLNEAEREQLAQTVENLNDEKQLIMKNFVQLFKAQCVKLP